MNTADKYYFETTKNRNPGLEKASHLLFNWSDCVAESEKEYFERVRKIKLLSTMKKIIENELGGTEKDVLIMKYINMNSFEEISSRLGLSRSCAARSLRKAERIVSEHMKYVFSFSETIPEKEEKPLDVKMAVASLFSEASDKNKIASRLKQSRTDLFISPEKAEFCTGIPKERILEIEKSGKASTEEVRRLITFYGISADYVFFGVD